MNSIQSLLARHKPGYALEQAFYGDPEVFQADLEAIFYSDWLFAVPACQLDAPGSFQRLKLGVYDILIVRNGDGGINAFHNTCRHRGSTICSGSKGQVARLTCPYHQWTYDLDGQLVWAREMGDNFDLSQHGLKTVHCREVAGLVYVCFAAIPPDFDRFADTVRPYLEPHDLNNAKVAHSSTIVEEGNWKLVWENNRECYHCAGNHPDLCQTYPENPSITGVTEGNEFPPMVENHFQRLEGMGIPSRYHLDDEGQFRVARMPLLEGAESYTVNGKPAVNKPLNNNGMTGAGALVMFNYPTTWNHFLADHALTFRINPIGPKQTEVTTYWLVHKDAVEGIDYSLPNLTRVWTNTNDEDRRVVEDNQNGINSPAYEPGPYSERHEGGVIQFINWYLNKLQAHAVPTTLVAE